MANGPQGGPAIPVQKMPVGTPTKGYRALQVQGYTAGTLDRAVAAGPMRPVVVIQNSDLVQNGGQYTLEGDVSWFPMIDMTGLSTGPVAGPAQAVLVVAGSL